MAVRVKNQKGRVIFQEQGELLFTHFGLSGPLILSASAHMRDFEREHYTIRIDLKPALEEEKMCIRDRLIPTKLEAILENREDIQYFASLYFNHPSIFFIGRNIDYAVGLEGSLKLKEISYIHSEAYAAGELKHGTISLIEPGTLVVALAGYRPLFEKTMSLSLIHIWWRTPTP